MSTNLDNRLKELVQIAKQKPSYSKQRRAALTELINTIVNSKKLWYPSFYQTLLDKYIYEEAVQNLWFHICNGELDKYDPNKGTVMAWINSLLRERFYPDTIKNLKHDYYTKYKIVANIDFEHFLETQYLDKSKEQELFECIESDPENLFKQAHIRNHPEANFQTLLKYRIYHRLGWEDISKELKIDISTLKNFFIRSLNKFSKKFREYLS